ncbi:MAG: hypothetical protein ACLURV_02840 [Gallintestinimicrobium sp.]
MVYLLNIKDTLAAQERRLFIICLNLRQANLVIEELRFINQMFGFIIGKLVGSHYRYYLFHRCDDLKYAVPDALSVIIGVTNVIPFLDRSSVRYLQRSWYS